MNKVNIKKKLMRRLSRREFLGMSGAAGLAMIINGCGDFYKTEHIDKKVDEILNKREDLIQKYQQGPDIILEEHDPRREESFFTVNEDQTFTLFYNNEFVETAELEKTIKEQVKDSVISSLPSTNQLIITVKNKNQLSYLEELLGNVDKLPPQVLLRFSVSSDFGDKAQDYASQLSLNISSQGREFGAFTGESNLPGAVDRVSARATMGTKWGGEIDTDAFNMKAVLDVMKTHGYVQQLFQTEFLASNGKKTIISGEEKLPIPAYVLQGREVIKTYNLETVKSSFEGTAYIYNSGMVNLVYTVGVGSSKRTEPRADFQVPVHDQVSTEGVYVRLGHPLIIAGKLNEMDLGITRKDAMLPWPASKDEEKSKTRIWYEVIPVRVTLYDYSKLARPSFKYKELVPAQMPVADPNQPK